MREVFTDLELGLIPVFFPEPFAVYQYYRLYDKKIPQENKDEIVLIIDAGAGTFNSCIIRTTLEGAISRGGATRVPLGLRANEFGGAEIDRKLLSIVFEKSKSQGVIWNNNPLDIESKKSIPALLKIEELKISLSDKISKSSKLSDNHSNIKEIINLEKGTFHQDVAITVEITGNDLKDVIREMWRSCYGDTILESLHEAKEKLSNIGIKLTTIDRVLVAGGSSKLPFIKEEIALTLRTYVNPNHIHIGNDPGNAVAFGLACACKEEINRDPSLKVSKLAPCLLNDLFIALRKERRGTRYIPKIKLNGNSIKDGQLLSSPFLTEATSFIFEAELPFELEDKLFYDFASQPLNSEDITPYNLGNDVVAIGNSCKISRNCNIKIDFSKDGQITPSFIFKEKGGAARKESKVVTGPSFYIDDFKVVEGDTFLGIDFGTSNSYVAKFVAERQASSGFDYPKYSINNSVLLKLREFEEVLIKYKENGTLERQQLRKFVDKQKLFLVFHSNKIEGNTLDLGETQNAIENPTRNISTSEIEAANLGTAFDWSIENIQCCLDEPEPYIREINKIITDGVIEVNGEYRAKQVTLEGMDFVPPPPASVPAYMRQLHDEIKALTPDRSIIEFAATIHTKLVSVHPFIDGNGRTARLFMNCILLAHDLPMIIINYNDKSRYLDALQASNNGDLSPLVEFFLECLFVQFEKLTEFLESPVQVIDFEQATDDKHDDQQKGIQVDNPLATAMKIKLAEIDREVNDKYLRWKNCFDELLAEMEGICRDFNKNKDYLSAGYYIRLKTYGNLDKERYHELDAKSKVSNCWYFMFEVIGPRTKEKYLLFFNHLSHAIKTRSNVYNVSLTLVRHDGSVFKKLTTEPITIREICVCNGKLAYIDYDNNLVNCLPQYQLQQLLAEIISAYL